MLSVGQATALYHSPPLLSCWTSMREGLGLFQSAVPGFPCGHGLCGRPCSHGDTETHKPRCLREDEAAQLVNDQRAQFPWGCFDALAGVDISICF